MRLKKGVGSKKIVMASEKMDLCVICAGLLYEQQTERVLEEMCYEEAVRVWRGREEKTYLVRGGEREGERGGGGGASRARDSQREKGRGGEVTDTPSAAETPNLGHFPIVLLFIIPEHCMRVM